MIGVRSGAAALAALLILGACSSSDESSADDPETAAETPADLVLTDGRIYTSNADEPWAEAVAIADGEFVFVGSSEDAEAFISDETAHQALDGELVTPGLIDAHTHPGLVAILGGEDDAQIPTTSLEDIQAWLAEYAATSDEPIIYASYWPNALFGTEGPRKEWLDEVVTDRPVILYDESGHSQWMNSAALGLLGVDASTPDPAPGLSEFARDPDGEPTGWVREFAAVPLIGDLFLPEDEVLHAELEAFIASLADTGVTSLMDGGNLLFHDKVYGHLADLEASGELPVRYEGAFHIFLPDQAEVAVDELNRLRAEFGGEQLTFNTVKIHFDGVLETGTAAVLEPYTSGPDETGTQLLTQQQVEDLLLEMQGENMNLHVHTVGDRAVRTILDAVEAVQEEVGGPLDSGVTLSHIELIDDADATRFADLGVIANYTPHWHGEYGSDVPAGAELIGAERAQIKNRARMLEDAGVTVTYSSDVIDATEAARANPWFGIQIGHTRQGPSGGENAPIASPEDQRLSIEQLLNGYTINAAVQLGVDDRLGSIAVGKAADLVVLDRDIFDIDPYEIAETEAIVVVKAGQVTRGQLSG